MRTIKRVMVISLVIIIAMSAGITAYGTAGHGRVYCRNIQKEKKIALTFDDGPHPRFTKQILDILAEYGVTATFFIIGVNAENYPESLKMIMDSGCEIGNHTYSHIRIDKMSETELEKEIRRCEDVLYTMTGRRPSVFRPPEGRVPKSLLPISEKLGYDVVLWSIDTLDWTHNSSENIYTVIRDNLAGGDIILMHDYVSGSNTACGALKRLIPELLSEGYKFVTVSELIN